MGRIRDELIDRLDEQAPTNLEYRGYLRGINDALEVIKYRAERETRRPKWVHIYNSVERLISQYRSK